MQNEESIHFSITAIVCAVSIKVNSSTSFCILLGNTNQSMFPVSLVVSENIPAHDDNDSSCKVWLQDY